MKATEAGKRKGKGKVLEKVPELEEVQGEIERMGGLEAYQRMSVIGQGKERGGGAENVCTGWLLEAGVKDEIAKTNGKARCVVIVYMYLMCSYILRQWN